MKKYFLFGILLVFLFGCITQNIEKNYSDQVVVNTFGPGEAAHVHEPTFDLETTLDVTKNPSDLPGPIKRNTSEIVKIHLESKEVISDMNNTHREASADWL